MHTLLDMAAQLTFLSWRRRHATRFMITSRGSFGGAVQLGLGNVLVLGHSQCRVHESRTQASVRALVAEVEGWVAGGAALFPWEMVVGRMELGLVC